jgi:carotenoid cleavage dioxygenase-like enzyme
MSIPRTILAPGTLGDLDLGCVAGAVPEGLTGEVFISTSEPETAGAHAFFGDGMMVRLSLRPGSHGAAADRWAWRVRKLDTASARLRAARPDTFESGLLGTMSPFGFSNAANTAPLPWGDRLFATWDAGRPVEIDPVTLGVLGEVGHRDDWAPTMDLPVLPMVNSTAHPVIDPERDCLWTVTFNPMAGGLSLVRWSGDGTRVDRWPVEGGVIPQSVHTITQTRDWLLVADCAFRVDPGELFGGERTVTTLSDEPVYLIRKDDVAATPVGQEVPATVVRVGPEVMHYYATYDDADGITVVFEHTPEQDLAMTLRAEDLDARGRPVDPALVGMYTHPMSPSRTSVLRFDPASGTVTERATICDPERYWATQLSALDWSLEGQTAPTVHHLLTSGFHPEVVTQRALALYGDRVDPSALPTDEVPPTLVTLDRESLSPMRDWSFAPGDYPSSPCFVPAGAGSGGSRYAGTSPGGHEGWLVVPVLNDGGFRVEVFDAADVGRGPEAVLAPSSGQTVPFLIHSAWMPRAVAAPTDVERLSFADELDDARLASLPDDLAAAAREVAAAMAAPGT